MIVDAHHHLWTADYPWLREPALAPIRRDFTVDDLRAVTAAAGVDRTILVEGGRCTDAETVRFLQIAGRTPEIAGVVGWAGLTDRWLAATIAAHRAGPGGRKLVGIRDQIQAYDDGHLDRRDVRAGLAAVADAGLVNEVVVRPAQLPSLARAAAALPGSTFVLDHLGKPAIRDGAHAAWRALIEPVAARPNVVAKLSGLVTEADWAAWRPADLEPYVTSALELFGPERLMFGSDWPVCELAAPYATVLVTMSGLAGGPSSAVFGDTAARTYGIDLAG